MELKEYLSKLTCRGCYNHCKLTKANCNRSKIFIKEATEKYERMDKYEQNKK